MKSLETVATRVLTGTGSLVCQGPRRRREETAWKRIREKSGSCDVSLLVMTYVVC